MQCCDYKRMLPLLPTTAPIWAEILRLFQFDTSHKYIYSPVYQNNSNRKKESDSAFIVDGWQTGISG